VLCFSEPSFLIYYRTQHCFLYRFIEFQLNLRCIFQMNLPNFRSVLVNIFCRGKLDELALIGKISLIGIKESFSFPHKGNKRKLVACMCKRSEWKLKFTSLVSFAVAQKLEKLVSKRFLYVQNQTDRSKKVFSMLIPGFLGNQ
jgi:hypothetical protein